MSGQPTSDQTGGQRSGQPRSDQTGGRPTSDQRDGRPRSDQRDGRPRGGDQRGVYAPFIAIIATALLFLGGIAYDAPRITAARQDAVHAANEAARVAAVTVASGGSLAEAEDVAEDRLATLPLIYGEEILLVEIDCVGSLVEATVVTGYILRSALAIVWNRRPIVATGAAEAVLLTPHGEPEALDYLGECPIIE